MKPARLTQTISDSLTTLRKSERKVAEFVLKDPLTVIRMRIVDLAQHAEVSEPTVVRFCRAVGCSGFQDFKLALAQQLASSPSYGQIAVTDQDSTREYTHKVFDTTVDTLLKVRDSLDLETLDAAIAAIYNAQRVEFYGFGASAAVAFDGQHKFFRLQITSAAYADPHLQNMSATSLHPGDVVIAISQSGRSQALLDSMELVKQAGGIVIGLSPTDSPVARSASISIHVDAKEDNQIYIPLSSRIAHLAVIDVLAIGVAQKKGPKLDEHLMRLKAGLASLRSPV
ncbi:MAG: SIS domain-containing protein [Cellvibrionales bacterium]|nr:SIS domain-containing protein [Porticoccaceae bacterium]|tara:strand:+ start:36875 stop:37726 length:852 start_codon:yes stop_codon:yes gene_type:complete